MSKYKVCFWMNTKSNHQNAFFEELYKNEQIDLQIRYISQPSQNRIDIGWDNSVLESYEFYVYTFEKAINSLNDFDERIAAGTTNIFTDSGIEFQKYYACILSLDVYQCCGTFGNNTFNFTHHPL